MVALHCAVVLVTLGALSVIDIRERRIPNALVAFLLLSDWVFAAFDLGPCSELVRRLVSLALAGAAVLFLLLVLDAFARRFMGVKPMGGGDVKLISAFAAMEATESLGLVLLSACILGTAFALLRRLPPGRAFPFGPFLSAGYVLGGTVSVLGM